MCLNARMFNHASCDSDSNDNKIIVELTLTRNEIRRLTVHLENLFLCYATESDFLNLKWRK